MEDDTKSVAAGHAALTCYIRFKYAGVSLASQEPTQESGSLGSLRGAERPPLTPLR